MRYCESGWVHTWEAGILDGWFAFRRLRLSAECSRRRRSLASLHSARRTRPVAARAAQLVRRQSADAVQRTLCTHAKLVRKRHRVQTNSWKRCFRLPIPCVPWTPSAISTFDITQTRSHVITTAHASMFQVLTGTCSSHAHRMWPDLNISSSERGGALQDAAPHWPRAACSVRGDECIAAASKTAAFAYPTMLPRCQMLVVAMFGRCSWLVSV